VLLPDGTNVNHTLVKDGWCWRYRKYAPLDTDLEQLEKSAREARKGLWADAQPVSPWERRKELLPKKQAKWTAAGAGEEVGFLYCAGVQPDGVASWRPLHFSAR
jgi:hypothetical protein